MVDVVHQYDFKSAALCRRDVQRSPHAGAIVIHFRVNLRKQLHRLLVILFFGFLRRGVVFGRDRVFLAGALQCPGNLAPAVIETNDGVTVPAETQTTRRVHVGGYGRAAVTGMRGDHLKFAYQSVPIRRGATCERTFVSDSASTLGEPDQTGACMQ